MLKNLLILLVSVSLIVSCSPTKYITSDQRVVDRNIIKVDNKDVKIAKLNKNAQPQQLKKFLKLFALRASIYNIVNPNKNEQREIKKKKKIDDYNLKQDLKFEYKMGKVQRKRNRYLNKSNRLKSENSQKGYEKAQKKYEKLNERLQYLIKNSSDLKSSKYKTNITTFADIVHNIGQEPPICDTFKVRHTCLQFENYMHNLGYLKSKVSYKIDTIGRKKVRIIYEINANKPLKIGSIVYNVPDSSGLLTLLSDRQTSRIKLGNKINFDDLEQFRTNFSEQARNNGFYYFSKQFITYRLDTTNNKYSNAILYVDFSKNVEYSKVYNPWYIRNVYVFNDYLPNTAMSDATYMQDIDTQWIFNEYNQKVYTLKKAETLIKPRYLIKEIYVNPDSLYSLTSTRTTYSHLSKFKIYKLVNIQYTEIQENDGKNYLDCIILLTPQDRTNFKIEPFASRNNLGFGLNVDLTFSHRNLFKGGEILEYSNQISIEHQKTNSQDQNMVDKFFNAQEYSASVRLIVPRLWAPFRSSSFIKRNNPSTVFDLMFSYQNRPEYYRLQTSFKYDYLLKSSNLASHKISVVRLSLIKATLTDDFRRWVERVNLVESYTNHLILGSAYNFTITNQGKNVRNIFYLNSNISLAGNLIYAAMKLTNQDTTDYYFKAPIINEPFAQFIKSDIEFRFLRKEDKQQYVFRLFLGAGLPFGNSHLLPFSEKFYVGGANSIRAWQARTLGPGEYVQPEAFKFINQTADIRLELNYEYRFNIISFLEGALFTDIGNIWNINSYDSRVGGIFYVDKFYKQLAIGSGFGLRVNVSFFVLRLDLGIKIVDPSLHEGKRFIPDSRSFEWSDLNPIFAIGYPF